MCFGLSFDVKPKPPRREKYGDEEKYKRDYAAYEKKHEEYMNKDNRRRNMANSRAGAMGGTTAAIS